MIILVRYTVFGFEVGGRKQKAGGRRQKAGGRSQLLTLPHDSKKCYISSFIFWDYLFLLAYKLSAGLIVAVLQV